MTGNWFRTVSLLILGAVFGVALALAWQRPKALVQQNDLQTTVAKLQEEVEHLKEIKPPNSHPMVDVAMFAANLWFAGERKNWPLANYYLSEMRNRMQWEVRVNPGPKGADGSPVDMKSIFDGISNGSLSKLKKVIETKDSSHFAAEYKHLLEDCYSCHQTAGRPYLRPMVPIAGTQPIINLDPAATWPQ